MPQLFEIHALKGKIKKGKKGKGKKEKKKEEGWRRSHGYGEKVEKICLFKEVYIYIYICLSIYLYLSIIDIDIFMNIYM